jgi:hypothetical protein
LQSGVFQIGEPFTRKWNPVCAGPFLVTAGNPIGGTGGSARWRIDLASRTVTAALAGPEAIRDGAAWEMVGTAETWEQVVTGRLNLAVALRHRRLRHCDDCGASPTLMNARMGMLAELLDVTAWRSRNGVATVPA